MDRREFVGGSLACMMAALLRVTPLEAEAAMQAVPEDPDYQLVFHVGGTRDAPIITVSGTIKAMDLSMDREPAGTLVVGGRLMHQYHDPVFTARFRGPFRIELADEWAIPDRG